MRRITPRTTRLGVLDLEARITPAYNLTITDTLGLTSNVVGTPSNGVTTFQPTGEGAVLSSQDIIAAFGVGDVVIDTNSGGILDQGNITWAHVANQPLFNASAIQNDRTMTFRTVNAAHSGDITFSGGEVVNGGDRVAFLFDTDGAGLDGAVDLGAASLVGCGLTITAGGGTATLKTITLTGNGAVTAANIVTTGPAVIQLSQSNAVLTLNGPLTVSAESTAISSTGDTGARLVFNGAVTGTGNLSVLATASQFDAPVSLSGPASQFWIKGGAASFTADAVSAPFIRVGQAAGPAADFGAGVSGVSGAVTVDSTGNLTPGDGLGDNANLAITGDVTISDGGSFDPDLVIMGMPAERLDVTGNLTLGAGARLGHSGAGTLATGDTTLVMVSGTRTGTFANAPPGIPFALAETEATATYTANAVTVAPVAFVTQPNTAVSADADGTTYTAKLTGPGVVATFVDAAGRPSFRLTGTTLASAFSLTTKANASDNVLTAGSLIVQGDLKSLTAGTTDFVGGLSVSGPARTITVRDIGGLSSVGGTAFDKTTLKARNVSTFDTTSTLDKVTIGGSLTDDLSAPQIGSVTVAGNLMGGSPTIDATSPAGSLGSITVKGATDSVTIKSLTTIGNLNFGKGIRVSSITAAGVIGTVTTGGDFYAGVTADSVGAVKVKGYLYDNGGGGWAVTGGVPSITAGAIGYDIVGFNFRARNVGTLSVVGDTATGVPANVRNASFHLTGNNLSTPAGFGVKTVSVKGTVFNSLFDVQEGNVQAVTVGRFIDSKLLLNYDTLAVFESATGFQSVTRFKLSAFTTTAATLNVPDSPLKYAFAGSQIAAQDLGTVRLSGLDTDNGGVSFGIKFDADAAFPKSKGGVRVKSTNGPLPLNKDLTPDTAAPYTAADNDFFYFGV